MIDSFDVVVIGGGQAGLASGYYLKQRKMNFVILESQQQPVGSWPHYYDSLKLFSPASFSSLPGMKFPGKPDGYPTKNEVIQYFSKYKEAFELPVHSNRQVSKVEKDGAYFVTHTTNGESYRSKAIINATGSFSNPYTPRIHGQELYQGISLHSSEYKSPETLKGKRVVVVGRGNSAVQIAVELADVGNVSLAVLRPIQFMKQRLGGKDAHFWLRVTGFDTFPFWRFGLSTPNPGSVIDLDRYEERVRSGNPNQIQMFSALDADGVIWQDGSKERVDAVIWATGYRPVLEHLQSLSALDDQRGPLQRAGVSTSVPGLYYVGLYGQHSFASATIRGVGNDAKYVTRKLVQHLRQNH